MSPGRTGRAGSLSPFSSPAPSAPVGEVIDQSEIWIFRFLYLGDPVMEVSVTRDELEGSDWRVVVPAEVEQRLRERDAQRSG
jgi:hypothetical protein